VVLTVILVCVVLIAALGFYAMHRSKLGRFRLSASFLKVCTFSIEVDSQDDQAERELSPGVDGTEGKSAA